MDEMQRGAESAEEAARAAAESEGSAPETGVAVAEASAADAREAAIPGEPEAALEPAAFDFEPEAASRIAAEPEAPVTEPKPVAPLAPPAPKAAEPFEVIYLQPGQSAPAPSALAPATDRLLSLDALRGFDMLWITGFHKVVLALAALVVAYIGNTFTHKGVSYDIMSTVETQLEHARWLTADYGRLAKYFSGYDMIMPLFLFMAGVSLPFSFAKRVALGQSKRRIYFHVALRAILLFILGMIHQGNLLNFTLSPAPARDMLHLYCNTLQAIACGYLIASVLYLNMRPSRQVWTTLGLIGVYWALLQFVPAPGGVRGVLTAKSNLATWTDQKVLGRFWDMTDYTWVLTSMVFGATVTIGSLAGQWLRSAARPWQKAFMLLFAGAALTAAGLGWSLYSPIVKFIWSSSFVLFSGGISLLLLGAFYLVIDVWRIRFWTLPLVVVGANAIVAYMADQFLRFSEITNRLIGGTKQFFGPPTMPPAWHGPQWYALIQASMAFGMLWFILYWMYKKRTFVKV